MSRPVVPATATPPSPSDDASAQALIDRQLVLLSRLADIGMEIAEAAGRCAAALAEGAATGAETTDPGLSYARAARAVRLTLFLQSKLIADYAAFARGEAQHRAREAARRRERIHTRVEQALEAERPDADEVEQLSSRVWEQLRETEDDDLALRPVAEVVARICRDIGLSPDWGAAAFAEPAPLLSPRVQPAPFTPPPTVAGRVLRPRSRASSPPGRRGRSPPPG